MSDWPIRHVLHTYNFHPSKKMYHLLWDDFDVRFANELKWLNANILVGWEIWPMRRETKYFVHTDMVIWFENENDYVLFKMIWL